MLALIAIHSMLLAQPPEGRGGWGFCSQTVVSDPALHQGVHYTAADSASGLHLKAYTVPGKRVLIGDKIDLRLAIINETAQVVGVLTGPGMRVRVADRNGVTVWLHPPIRPRDDGAMIAAPGIGCPRTVLPTQPFEFGLTWDLTDQKGRAVPAGEYVVFLSVYIEPKLAAAPGLRITVAPRGRR